MLSRFLELDRPECSGLTPRYSGSDFVHRLDEIVILYGVRYDIEAEVQVVLDCAGPVGGLSVGRPDVSKQFIFIHSP